MSETWGRWKRVGAGDLAENVEYKVVAEDVPNRGCIPATLYPNSHEETQGLKSPGFFGGSADEM